MLRSWVSAVFWVLFIVIMIAGVFLVDAKACHNRWVGVAETKYEVIGGCRVELSADKFVPEKRWLLIRGEIPEWQP